jgi:hypothetical protein
MKFHGGLEKNPRRTQCTIRSAVNHLQNLFNVKTVSWKLFKFYSRSKTTNKQPKRKLVRQIILEINSLDMQTHRNFLFLVVPLLFMIILFSLTNIFYLALSQSEFPARYFDNCKEKSREILDWLINKGIITWCFSYWPS